MQIKLFSTDDNNPIKTLSILSQDQNKNVLITTRIYKNNESEDHKEYEIIVNKKELSAAIEALNKLN